jgi:ribose-phosphate pyrophosphokinase
MKPLLFALEAPHDLGQLLLRQTGFDAGEIEQRRFPDGESYVRLLTSVAGREVVLLCSLDRPDTKTLPLLFAADAARAQGARRIGLVAPYLGYMRQDKAFHPGEAITSVTFARLLSGAVDWLVTLDPHLHRYPTLASVYSVPSFVASAAKPIAGWIRDNLDDPVLVGPDEESSQWVARIAELAHARSTVFRKTRSGDFSVAIAAEGLARIEGGTPVIIDDIASSARTMIEAVRVLREAGQRPPVCIAVHPIFAGDAYEKLNAAGPAAIVSTNAVAHASNAIDVSAEIATEIERALALPSSAREPGAAETVSA